MSYGKKANRIRHDYQGILGGSKIVKEVLVETVIDGPSHFLDTFNYMVEDAMRIVLRLQFVNLLISSVA